MTKQIISLTLLATVLLTGCAVKKPLIKTGNVMQYNLTNVDITDLNTSKVCLSSENKDISIRKAAELSGFSKVYAVDNEVTMQTQLWGPDIPVQQCIIVYGK